MMSRLAILGLDHWYWAYGLADAAQQQGVRIVGIWDQDYRKKNDVAQRYGAIALAEPDDAFETNDVDLVLITSTTDRHVDLAVRAASAGKAIICNKPLGRTLEEARAIVRAVKAQRVPFQSIEQGWRHFPVFVQVKEVLASGALGPVLTVNTVTRSPLPQKEEGAAESGWFTDASKTAGGAFMDHAVYSFDLISWLLESPVETVTYAEMLRSNAQIAAEDYGLATIRFANGAIGTVEETWFSPAFSLTVEVRGTEGELTAQVGRAPAIYLHTRKEGCRIVEALDEATYGPALKAFLAALERGEDSSESSLRMMELCCQAYQIASGLGGEQAAGTGLITNGV